MSDTLQRYGMQHTRLPCWSPTPRVYSNSCPLSRWCHPAISSSVILFSSCLSSHQVAKISEFQFQHQSFQWIFRTDFLWWTSWISLESKDSRVSPTSQLKSINSLALSFLAGPTLTSICDHWKTIALTRWTFVDKVLSLLFNMLSRLVITFLPRTKHLLISWLQSPSAVILEPQKIKSVTISTVSPSICHEVMGPDAMILVFWTLSFKSTFSFSPFTSSRGSLVLHFLP